MLEKAKTAIRQKQQGILTGDNKNNPITLDTVKAVYKVVLPVYVPHNKPTRPTAAKQTLKQCNRCGTGSHK